MESSTGNGVIAGKEGFCHDDLWDTDYLLNASWPRFTDCFQFTVLIYTPCSLLWLPLPIYLYSLASNKKAPLPLTKLSLAKVLIAVTLVVLGLVLIVDTVTRDGNDRHVSPAEYLACAVRTASYAVMIFLTIYERYRHVTSSAVGFIFWFILVLCDVIPLYTQVIKEESDNYLLPFYLFVAIYVLEVLVLLLNFPADAAGVDEYQPMASPEAKASFVVNLCYLWIARILYSGWRRELKEDDLFSLNPRDTSDTLMPPFEKTWKQEISSARLKNLNKNRSTRHSSSKVNTYFKQFDEKQSILSGINAPDYGTKAGNESVFASQTMTPEERKHQTQPSLLKVLLKWKGGHLLAGLLEKIVSDVFLLVSPVVLSLLIAYADNQETQQKWQGYSLSILLFISLIFKGLLFNRSFWTGEVLGMQLSTTLITAIYKKALTMNNRAKQTYTAGDIVNLMSVDTLRVRDVMNFFYFAWATPIQTIVIVIILYQYIGWAVFMGLAALLLMVPINSYTAAKFQSFQVENMRLKDERLRLVNETLSGMKVIKLYAWEPAFQDKISEIRQRETNVLMKMAYMSAVVSTFFATTPLLVMMITFSVYTKSSDDHVLDANKAFVTMSYFGLLQVPLILLSDIISMTVQAVVSIRRINKFLCTEDLNPDNIIKDHDGDYAVDVKDGSFTWDSITRPTLKKICLKVPEGSLTAVVGTVGSGKSSLTSALLGEMDKLSGYVRIKGSVAYVPQQAWMQNATIRDNILFGNPFNKRKFEQVIFACALEQDLQILSAGEMTEIGEKGINLSGGQKQRISLARAVYSESDVYILDDPLSAVDSHVGKHIFQHVISKEGILKGKTRILVTHGIHWLTMVDTVLVMEDGQISESGNYESLMAHNGPFAQFVKTFLLNTQEEEAGSDEDDTITSKIVSDVENLLSDEISTSGDEKKKLSLLRRRKSKQKITSSVTTHIETIQQPQSGKLIQEEKIESGQVKKAVFGTYAIAAGVCPILFAFGFYLMFQVFYVLQRFWISDWTQNAILNNASLVGSQEFVDKQDYYLAVFGVLGLIQTVFLVVNAAIYWTRMVVAARRIHQSTLKSVFRCPMAFFDTTPRGRILNRFSRDIEVVDDKLPRIIRDYMITLLNFVATLVSIIISTPLFLTILVPILIVFLVIQSFYVPTSRQLKRIESVTRSPVYSHFSETIAGASTIRAYEKTDWFVTESKRRLDRNQSLYYLTIGVNRSVSFYMDVISSVIIFGSALFGIITPGINGSILGLSVSYAFQTAASVVWMVRQRSELETNIISVERLKEYSSLSPEDDWIVANNRPSTLWPSEGKLEFKDYKTSYRPGLDLVLRGISCSFSSGEKIGIVGRTGAGKSSLALALFRLIEASEGSILVDDVQISDIGLHDVRSNLTILPQDPVLFYGSLRVNLDPINQHRDDQLWDALTTAHLKDFVQSLPQGLDYQVGEEGQSLSVGQRQLVCLARALLKKSKILVLDEATAAVDMETDKLIQDTIRTEFKNCTIICIAHRLNTILDYDRIMVLDNGLIKEMDTPSNLLANPNSAFYTMAKDANLV